MALIDEYVQVTITRQTAVASVASFDNMLIAAEFLKASITPSFDERVRVYSSLSELATAGFSTSSPVYLAAAALFSQNPNPGKIYVGRKLTGIDGSETWDAALTAMKEENNEWYVFSVDSRILADLEDVADWSETNKKLFSITDDDPNIIGGTGDIAEYINTQNYDRSFLMYHPDADAGVDDPYANFAWPGLMLTYDPGEANWLHKTLRAVPAYNLTSAERSTIEGKKGNYYSTIAGLDKTLGDATVGSGEYIDIIRGTDWLEARIQELVYTALGRLAKIPFTDQGIGIVVSQVEAALQEAVEIGLLAPPDADGNPSYTVTAPLAADVSVTDKGNRFLPDVEFTATYAGAINRTEIRGTISV